jgi:putative tryptophan/tyrosine transport system substrate-binding protein
VEPDNVAIEFRWAAGQLDQLPTLARDLVGRRVDVIAATAGGGATAALAAKNATSTIPIVFTTGVDPVKMSLVTSFNRPGGNVTGIAFLSLTLDAKRLELLLELVPKVKTVAALLNPTFPDAVRQLHEIQEASRAFRQRIVILRASNIQEIDTAFGNLVEMQAGALLVGADPFLLAGTGRSSRWRHATRFPPSMRTAATLWQAGWLATVPTFETRFGRLVYIPAGS